MSGRLTGLCAIALAVAFNVPYALLAARFDYPGILREPAGEVLAAFAAGGPTLIVTWYAFFLCALAVVPLASGLAFADPNWVRSPAMAVAAAMLGALAGVVQAVGLSRWIFVVPGLARQHSDAATSEAGRLALETNFDMLNLWAGVAIGEHTGQILTCLWVGAALSGQLALPGGRAFVARVCGVMAIVGIGFGLGEGLAIALEVPSDIFSIGTIIGYLAFSAWLVATGFMLMGRSVVS